MSTKVSKEIHTSVVFREVAKRVSDGTDDRSVSIKVNKSDLDINEFIDELVRPLLYGVGFSTYAVEAALGDV